MSENEKGCGIKAFFKGLFSRWDKKIEEKARAKSCCCCKPSGGDKGSEDAKPLDKEKKSCCS